jgi:ketosteroid isomerase-like protein
MKAILILSLILVTGFSVSAQSKDEQAVAKVIEELRQAMLDGDSAKLAQLTDDALTYGHSLGKLENKQQFVGALASGKSDFQTLDITDQKIIVKNKTAVVRHNIAANILENGKSAAVKLHVLLVFNKDHKQWKLLGRQAVRLSTN